MTDYRVTIKVQNNNIVKRILDAGFKNVSDFCKNNREGRINECVLGKLVNMKKTPFTKNGDFIDAIKKCSMALGCLPEDLFNENQLNAEIESNIRTYELSEADMRYMLLEHDPQEEFDRIIEQRDTKKVVDKVLETLTPREKKVLEFRNGINGHEATLEETGRHFGVTRERIRHIENKALRKLRHPDSANLLREVY